MILIINDLSTKCSVDVQNTTFGAYTRCQVTSIRSLDNNCTLETSSFEHLRYIWYLSHLLITLLCNQISV